MKNDILKVGDTVLHRGRWGNNAPKLAIVETIDKNCNGDKYGIKCNEIPWKEVTNKNCVVGLDNGHWAYGNQIS